MNCKRENYESFIRFKAYQWYEIATRAIDKHYRSWGRKNYQRLVRAHPEIFGDPGSEVEGAEASEIHVAPVHTPTSKSHGNGQPR